MRSVAAGVLATLWAGAAFGADKVEIGAAPGWVRVDPAPAAPTAPSTADAQILFSDHQDRFTADGQDSYVRNLFLVRTPQGLAGLGTLAVVWNPDTDAVTVNAVHIIRGGEVIDVLADQSFTVLRRETSLELAVLNGQLTAAIQPAGLEVGDIIDFAFTLHRKDPVYQGKAEFLSGFNLPIPIERLRVREVWTPSKPVRWRETRGLDAPKLTKTADGQELLIDMAAVQPLKPPKGAPARYGQLRQLEISEFSGWSEVAALTAPLFDKAATLKPDSPLKAEIARIAAASADPGRRAAMALQLVQDKVRYVFLGMNLGGYVPASADLTWSRRFGDCKGKTALLIALLKGLGIEAEPALVSTTGGDGLDARLPMLEPFDHVIVRAVIGGKVYWLDGTRLGDRSLDAIAPPAFSWALPVRASGSQLERLITPPLTRPNIEVAIRLDASAGTQPPAPAHIEVTYRGDMAAGMRTSTANLGPADLDRFNKAFWKAAYSWIDVDKAETSYDPEHGEEHMVMDGHAHLDWSKDSSGRSAHTISASTLGWTPDFDREAGADAKAPFAVDYPSFTRKTETLLLPLQGAGFQVAGADVDRTIAGVEFKRSARIDKNVLTMTASSRAIAPEFPAGEAPSAAKALKALWEDDVVVKAPPVRKGSADAAEVDLTVTPTTAAGFAARGEAYLTKKDFDHAIADYGEAHRLDPSVPRYLAARGIGYLEKGDLDRAGEDFDAALKQDSAQSVALRGRGFLLLQKHDFSGAVKSFDAALAAEPGNAFSLRGRGQAHFALHDEDAALADFAEAIRINPDMTEAYGLRAEIFAARGDMARADAELDRMVARKPRDAQLYEARGDFLVRHGRRADAVKAYSQAIAIKPSSMLYLSRAAAAPDDHLAARLADVDAAAKLDPGSPLPHHVRGQILAQAKRYEEAAREYEAALKLKPDDVDVLASRATMFAETGRPDAAKADLERAVALRPDNADVRNAACWLKATRDLDLKGAMADCDAALRLRPDTAAFLDSRGFVHLKLGEPGAAVADYDAALKIAPKLAASLFGRGVAKLRLGRTQDGQADLAAARAVNARIDEEFAGYGVKP